MIANIAGEDEDQFVAMAEMLGAEPGLAAIELNISCPNVSHGLDLGIDAARGRQAGAAGPRRLSAADHRQADAERDRHRADRRGGGRGRRRRRQPDQHAPRHGRRLAPAAADPGLRRRAASPGPAIKPIALRMVWDVARALPGLPIIGIGGIATADDALEFLVAGASAVQVGTATFYDPTASERLLDDLTAPARRGRRGRRPLRSSARFGRIAAE